MVPAKLFEPGGHMVWIFNQNQLTFGLTPADWTCLANRLSKYMQKGVLK